MIKLIALLACLGGGVAQAATINHLAIPPGYPLTNVQGYNCGGVRTALQGSSVDVNGNIVGYVTSWTTCSSGGRGSHPHTYSVTSGAMWDGAGNFLVLGTPYAAAVQSSSPLVDRCYPDYVVKLWQAGDPFYCTVWNAVFGSSAITYGGFTAANLQSSWVVTQ